MKFKASWRKLLTVYSAVLFSCPSLFAANVSLAWDPSPDTVSGYYLYYGTNSGSFNQRITLGNSTNTTVSNLTTGVTYFFRVTAFNSASLESDFSNEVAFPELLRIATILASGKNLHLSFNGEIGKLYRVDRKFSLGNDPWLTIASNLNTTATNFLMIDSMTTGRNEAFYRVTVQP